MNRKYIALTILGLAFSLQVKSAVEPSSKSQVKKRVSGRVPASAAESYPKAKEGIFEAQGFGEDIYDPDEIREPATEKKEKKEKNKFDKKEDDSKDPKKITTVKMRESLENELQLQRRVDVFYEGRVRLKNGAAIWATEDAGTVTPKLEITAPAEVDTQNESIRFRVYSNYLPFIKRWELRIFRKEKLKSAREIALLKGSPEEIFDIEYKLKPNQFAVGDSIYYQLKVFSSLESDKVFDLVKVKKISFIERLENQNLAEADKLTEAEQIAKILGNSSLEIQNIPIRGSRVRLVGNNIPIGHTISYREQIINVDEFGKFVIEEHFPKGKFKVDIRVQDKDTKEEFVIPFKLDVSGNYFFMVGLADFRIGESKLSEKVSGLVVTDEYDGNVFVDGRLAYFLKGKVKGKYLITSQLDTTEGPIEDMFKGIHRKNSESLFRRLDPDRYYPVYGDNSSTTEEAPTLGKFYVKIETDQSYLMWGNANSNLTGTLLSQYNRTLYGAHANYQSREQTKYGDRKNQFSAFTAEPETLLGHNEFAGTGGVLYYLRHNDVVQGSEKLVIEVRDRDSSLLKKQITLKPYQDYEFDYLAGRVVLTQPLSTFVAQAADEIIDPNGIGNDRYYLVADYEYSDTGEGLDNLTYGGRVNKWFGDHLSLGGTYVKEKKGQENYTLKGIDTSLRLGTESFVKLETSESSNEQTNSNFISSDGGFNFEKKTFVSSPGTKASAWAIESQLFLNDFIDSKTEGVLSTWYRGFDAGFSTARRQSANDLKEYGYDLELDFKSKNFVKSKLVQSEEKNGQNKNSFLVSYGRRLKDNSRLSAEYRVDELELGTAPKQKGQLLGMKYGRQFSKSLGAYIKGQTTVEKSGGYEPNDRLALGGKFNFSQKWDGNAEYSVGDRGDAALFGLGYNITQSYKVYANLDRSADTASGPVSNGITLGQRKTFRNGVRLTAENKFEETADAAGINQLYGLDYNLNRLLTMSFSFQLGEVTNNETGDIVEKQATGVGIVYTKDTDITASSKLSLVKDRGDRNLDQVVFTNSLKFRVTPSQTWFLEADYSLSEDPLDTTQALSRYMEGNVGYAYRPIMNDRLNLFGRYTYLYDLDSQAQENARNDQKIHIASVEATYDLTRRWGLGFRFAEKIGSERLNRDQGAWVDTTLSFAQARLRYHLIKKWDALAEYRMVKVKESLDLQSGFLVGLDYHIGGNLKVGLGFNFTRFNDDLTNFNFNNYGWFLNFIGKM